MLAAAVGATNLTWRAYLSAVAEAGKPAVNARDRIGAGPWFNYAGVEVAKAERVRIFTVGLRSSAFNPTALETLATSAGGEPGACVC